MKNLIKQIKIMYWLNKINNCKGVQRQMYYAEISKIKYNK
jgi:ribosomal protein S8